jgi:hypothetical protein
LSAILLVGSVFTLVFGMTQFKKKLASNSKCRNFESLKKPSNLCYPRRFVSFGQYFQHEHQFTTNETNKLLRSGFAFM